MTLYHPKLETVEKQQLLSLKLEKNTFDPQPFAHLPQLNKGWTLPTARPVPRCTPKQKQFHMNKFNNGLNRRVRWQPVAVVFEMKNSVEDKTGELKFVLSEFLRVSTVRVFFSRQKSRKIPLLRKSSQHIVWQEWSEEQDNAS
jgi:hypothetical protein